MPTYEYRCNACGNTFEVFKSIKDETVPECPKCGSNDVTRLISATSFILKGSGWYMTDYGNKHSPSSSKPAEHTKSSENTSSTKENGKESKD